MAKAFGFNDDELKLLLVAVRQMRRTFAQPRKQDPGIEAYAALYDALFEKLTEMAGPIPETARRHLNDQGFQIAEDNSDGL
jgi:hypothetical protein